MEDNILVYLEVRPSLDPIPGLIFFEIYNAYILKHISALEQFGLYFTVK